MGSRCNHDLFLTDDKKLDAAEKTLYKILKDRYKEEQRSSKKCSQR